ncbi:MAG: molybdenum cofactor biosynthesis protein MoaE [Chloroflexi bacterium]|nr:molybdenum cofactor biosynthesis protein MoaE [Chloroflexota bacterium]
MYRELAGKERLELDVEGASSVASLLGKIKGQFPKLAALSDSLMVAVNAEYVTLDYILKEGDEVALIPPVSGGGEGWITKEPISPEAVAARVRRDDNGAVVVFLGTVRLHSNERVVRYLQYDAYEEMAEKKLRQIAHEIEEKWGLKDVTFCHRVGRMKVGEIAVVIAVGSPHRKEAFAACQYAIDRLKVIVPIWKKEVYEDGACWIGKEGEAGHLYPAEH